MARKPIVKSRSKRQSILGGAKMAKKNTAKPLTGKKSSFQMGSKPATKKLKGTIPSFAISKKPPTPKRMAQDKRTGNFGMSKRPQGSSPKQDSIDKRIGSYFSGIKGGWG